MTLKYCCQYFCKNQLKYTSHTKKIDKIRFVNLDKFDDAIFDEKKN